MLQTVLGLRRPDLKSKAGSEWCVGLPLQPECTRRQPEYRILISRARSSVPDFSSLAETVGRYKPVKKWVVYRGETEQVLDNGVRVYPYLTALARLKQS
jgi:ribosomal protein S16